jgi:hypothetical protein
LNNEVAPIIRREEAMQRRMTKKIKKIGKFSNFKISKNQNFKFTLFFASQKLTKKPTKFGIFL